jgi:hypothetical protein
METKEIHKIIEITKRIKDYNEVISAFVLDFTVLDKDYRTEVISEFENLKKKEMARLKAIYILKKQKKILGQDENLEND